MEERRKDFFEFDYESRSVRIGRWRFALPRSRAMRIFIAGLLILGGILGFLPILGFWMLPLGILLLSMEFHAVRRQRRKAVLWWGRLRRGQK